VMMKRLGIGGTSKLLAFLGVALCFLGACKETATPDRNVFSTSAEQLRVTSPNGHLDAVLVRDPYGGAIGGGVHWNVYIVLKGSPVSMSVAHEVFQADPFSGGNLIWKREHLLEIHYDIAKIEEFRNLWGLHEVEDVGNRGEGDYEVEIRLVPSSEEFSILTPDGALRHGN
jgi:hypothetical protein